MRQFLSIAATYTLLMTTAIQPAPIRAEDSSKAPNGSTPIKHLVVIFQENVSFDHYFATYPNAANPPDEPEFHAARGTPSVNGLTGGLLTRNPNAVNPQNGTGAVNPFRLDRSQAVTADQGHSYTPEQMAFDSGLMDLFPKSVGVGDAPPSPTNPVDNSGLTMGYYDGNTVTAMWNYAQHFSMSDNSWNTMFGPSTPGAFNLIAGQTNGVIATKNNVSNFTVDGGNGFLSVIGDADPLGDVCSSSTRGQVQMGGQNVGDLLSAAGVTWGWFEGGFDLTIRNPNGTTGCARSSPIYTGVETNDYIPHHQPFQYYASTANPTHARPSSVLAIGHNGDGANHQYDINDFYHAVREGNFPAVTFLKAAAYQDGHAGYSDPLDEQQFLVHVLNFLQQRPEWSSTAVVIAYDDSDGWYDHQMGPILNQSTSSADALTGPGACGNGATALPGYQGSAPAQGRCGYGPRLPLLLISPFAKHNFVDHATTDQSSILRFIEDNWLGGARIQGSFDALAGTLGNMLDFTGNNGRARALFLDESTGEVSGRGDE